MYLFKTSGTTFNSVIRNQKHAFSSKPRSWISGELVLVSKNKVDCQFREKQIQYTMQLVEIRRLSSGEVERYWPGNEGRWKYLFVCDNTELINQPFNLEDILGEEYRPYWPIMTYRKIAPEHEHKIVEYLRKVGTVKK